MHLMDEFPAMLTYCSKPAGFQNSELLQCEEIFAGVAEATVHIGPAHGHIRKLTVFKNRGIGLKISALGKR